MPRDERLKPVVGRPKVGVLYSQRDADLIGEGFANQLRQLIENCGVTQHQIARDTGIRQSSISKFLHGGSMKIETLGVLLDYFGLTLALTNETSTHDRKES